MPSPSTWQAADGLARENDPLGLSRVAGLQFTVRCPDGSWPLLTASGGVRRSPAVSYLVQQSNGYEVRADTNDTTTATWLGTLSIPGDSVPSITQPEKDWSHVSVQYGSEFTLTPSRLTPAMLIESSKTSLRLCGGTVPIGWTTDGTSLSYSVTPLITPKFVAWHTAGGYQVAVLSSTPIDLTGMDQPWIMVWWGNQSHWCECTLPMTYSHERGQGWACFPEHYAKRGDCPLLITFGVNPSSIVQTAGVGGFDLAFPSALTALSILPLYGRIHPDATVTNLWVNSAAIPTGVKNLIQAWYPRGQQFPRSVARTYAHNLGTDVSSITESIIWTQVRAGGQKYAPLVPMDGVALDVPALAARVNYSGTVVDGLIVTEFGPILGIVGVDSYTYTITGLAPYTVPRTAMGLGAIPPNIQSERSAIITNTTAHPHWQGWYLNCRMPQGGTWGEFSGTNPADTLIALCELLAVSTGAERSTLLSWLDTERTNYPPETVYADVATGAGTTPRGGAVTPLDMAIAYMHQELESPPNVTHPITGIMQTRVTLWSAWALARYYQETGHAVPSGVVTTLVNLLDTNLIQMDWATGNWFSGPGESVLSFVGYGEERSATANVNSAYAGLNGLAWLCAQVGNANEGLVRALMAKFAMTRIGMTHFPRWQYNVGLLTYPTDLGSSANNQAWLPLFTRAVNHWEGFIFHYTWVNAMDDTRDVNHCTQFGLQLDDSTHRILGWGYQRPGNNLGDLIGAQRYVRPLAKFLKDTLGAEAEIRVNKIQELFGHWYQPYTEPIPSQEMNIAFQRDSLSIFKERAWLNGADAPTLDREAGSNWLVDGPDLHYIEKFSEVIRAYSDIIPPGPYAANITDTGTTSKRSKFEVTFNILSTSDAVKNTFLPYDPSPPAGQDGTLGISVFMECSQDNFATISSIWPCFVSQSFDHQIKGGRDWLYPTSSVDISGDTPAIRQTKRDNLRWKARASFWNTGLWQYRLRVTDAGGTNLSGVNLFSVTDAAVAGRVRPAPLDPRYFQTEDGLYHPVVGFNMKYGVLSFDNPTVAAATLATFGAAGVNYGRVYPTDWGWWGSEGQIWEATQPADKYPYVSAALSAPALTPYPLSELARYVATGFSSSYLGHLKGTPPCKRSTNYLLEILFQIPARLTGPLQAGQSYGFAAKTSAPWIFNYSTEPEEYNKGVVVGTPVAGIHGLASGGLGTTDGGSLAAGGLGQHTAWQKYTGIIATGPTQDFLDYLILTCHNCTGSAAAYYHSVSLREDLGGGNYGPNIISQETMDRFTDVDQRACAQFDLVLQAAEAAGIALQTMVLGNEQEPALAVMLDNGTIAGSNSAENFLGAAGSRARWIKKHAMRQFYARYAWSTKIFALEDINEGPWDSARHFESSQELGVDSKSFGDSPMVVTSSDLNFTKSRWDTYPVGDYGGPHLYRQLGGGTGDTLRVDVNTIPETITVGSAVEFYDTAQLTNRLSLLIGTKQPYGHLTRPTFRMEVGLNDTSDTNIPSAVILADTGGIWFHNFMAAQLCNAGGMIDSYWFVPEHIYDPADGTPNHLHHIAPLRSIIATHALNNGHYIDAAATLSDPTNLGIIGQKDLVNSKAYAWIYNKGHTAKEVIDGTPVTPGTGTLLFTDFTPGNYGIVWIDTYTGAIILGETVVATPGNLLLTFPVAVSTDIGVSIALTSGPSGTPGASVASFSYGAINGGSASFGLGGFSGVTTVDEAIPSFAYGSVVGGLGSFGFGGRLALPVFSGAFASFGYGIVGGAIASFALGATSSPGVPARTEASIASFAYGSVRGGLASFGLGAGSAIVVTDVNTGVELLPVVNVIVSDSIATLEVVITADVVSSDVFIPTEIPGNVAEVSLDSFTLTETAVPDANIGSQDSLTTVALATVSQAVADILSPTELTGNIGESPLDTVTGVDSSAITATFTNSDSGILVELSTITQSSTDTITETNETNVVIINAVFITDSDTLTIVETNLSPDVGAVDLITIVETIFDSTLTIDDTESFLVGDTLATILQSTVDSFTSLETLSNLSFISLDTITGNEALSNIMPLDTDLFSAIDTEISDTITELFTDAIAEIELAVSLDLLIAPDVFTSNSLAGNIASVSLDSIGGISTENLLGNIVNTDSLTDSYPLLRISQPSIDFIGSVEIGQVTINIVMVTSTDTISAISPLDRITNPSADSLTGIESVLLVAPFAFPNDTDTITVRDILATSSQNLTGIDSISAVSNTATVSPIPSLDSITGIDSASLEAFDLGVEEITFGFRKEEDEIIAHRLENEPEYGIGIKG